MSEIAIKVEGLSKKYTIGKQKDGSLRNSLGNFFSGKSSKTNEFWALKDISFEIEKGDVVGIIGKNGAGKSTLLKILSQITKPSEGTIEIDGRIASLLEVGTGFHPELTGRENVYLNGTILGMTRKEVKAKFEEIVAFSGVEKFIDTPVKHYSSGMYVRLAFAVAAHLEPEILIIDEVLAVGDAEFQKKCLGKMKDIAGEGRTVLFVSHDIEAVSTLCNKGILLDNSQIKLTGDIHAVLKSYTENYQDSYKVWPMSERPGNEIVKLNKICIVNQNSEQINQVFIDQEFGVYIEYEVFEDDVKPAPNFHFYTGTNIYCFIAIAETASLKKGTYKAVTWIPAHLLNNQTYKIGVALTALKTVNVYLELKEVINIEILEHKTGRNNEYGGTVPGVVRPEFKSEISLLN